ncbi:hypothetical protein GCM10027056_31010 [Glaciibacter psychrotolerans]
MAATEVTDLVQREEERRVKACAGASRGHTAGGLDQILDESRDERGRIVRSGPGGQEVQGAVAMQEFFGVEPFAVAGGDGIHHPGIRQCAQRE